MHVLQYIAVKADSDDEAMRLVENKLQQEMGGQDQYLSWYDWFVIGGGRFVEGNPYESSPNHIISYDKAPLDYRSMIDNMISNRMDEFESYRKSYGEKGIDLEAKLDNYRGVMNYDFELYPLKKMIDMIQGEWDMNSYFYDMHHASTNPDHMYKNIDLGNKNWYLVPVDFHF
jgi:hypothetical protein